MVHAQDGDGQRFERDGQKFDQQFHAVLVTVVDWCALQDLIARL